MARHLRRFLFKLYLPLLIVVVGATLAGFLRQLQWLSLVASGVALAHFVQNQQLQELDLFHRLFADFNTRYNRLNVALQELLIAPRQLTPEDRSRLLDYFNLCGEEFFFYAHGLIPRTVWRAWCRGMLEYLDDERIARLWSEEEVRGSYYGLSRGIIEKGADRDVDDRIAPQPIRRAA